MADLLGNDIGLNYKGLLNLDTTINTGLDGTLRVVTDGEGDSSPLYLSTTAIGLGTTSIWDNTNARLGIGTTSPQVRLQVTTSGTGTMLFNGAVIQQTDSYFYLRNNNGQFYFQNNAGATTYMSLISGKLGINVTATAQLDIVAAASTVGLYVKGAASTDIARFYNSAGTAALTINDGLAASFGGSITSAAGIATSIAGFSISGVGGNGFNASGGGFIIFKSSGILCLTDSTDADFNRLQLGGTSSSFPALKRSTTNLQVRLADDSGYAPIDASLYKVAGVSGFTGTGIFTSFTIEGGIITAAS